MARATKSQINCSLCNKPVNLETAKTDDNGRAVHAECYILAIAAKLHASPRKQQPAS